MRATHVARDDGVHDMRKWRARQWANKRACGVARLVAIAMWKARAVELRACGRTSAWSTGIRRRASTREVSPCLAST